MVGTKFTSDEKSDDGDYPGVRAAIFHSPKFLNVVPSVGSCWVCYIFLSKHMGTKEIFTRDGVFLNGNLNVSPALSSGGRHP